MTSLNLSLYEMFLYLANATLRLDCEQKDKVFQDMAYKLMEWDDVKRDEIRKVLRQFDIKLEEICEGCNEHLPDHDGEGEARCDECSK
jgi:hypothetical protein